MKDLPTLYPHLYCSLFRQGSLPIQEKRFEISIMGDERDRRKFSLRIMGTGFMKTYGPTPNGLDGIGTCLYITRGIPFYGDISVITPIDVMEHCALQNVIMINQRFSLCLN